MWVCPGYHHAQPPPACPKVHCHCLPVPTHLPPCRSLSRHCSNNMSAPPTHHPLTHPPRFPLKVQSLEHNAITPTACPVSVYISPVSAVCSYTNAPHCHYHSHSTHHHSTQAECSITVINLGERAENTVSVCSRHLIGQ